MENFSKVKREKETCSAAIKGLRCICQCSYSYSYACDGTDRKMTAIFQYGCLWIQSMMIKFDMTFFYSQTSKKAKQLASYLI